MFINWVMYAHVKKREKKEENGAASDAVLHDCKILFRKKNRTEFKTISYNLYLYLP